LKDKERVLAVVLAGETQEDDNDYTEGTNQFIFVFCIG